MALPCNTLAAIALVLLALNPADNLPAALAVLIPAALALYGSALIMQVWKR